MFADTSKSAIYITTDEGETFRSYDIPVDPRTLKIHPTMTGWILGCAHGRHRVMPLNKDIKLSCI